MKEEFENIFSILKNGSQEEVKVAKKKLDKLWHGDSESFKKHAPIALKQLGEFDVIQNPKNQEAFISGLNLFFLALSDEHFKKLKDFVLKVICHQNGHVREQMRKTADWMYISLSSRIHPFVWPRGKKLTQKQIEEQEEAKKEFAEYLSDIESLMEKYYERSYGRVKYVSSLKPSVYKSLQLLLSDLTRGNLHKNLHTPPPVILAKREEIEKELSVLIKKTKSDITLDEIQDIIYEETDFEDLNDIIRAFDMGSPYELQNIIETLNEAWNYFPHRVLNGLCPAEIAHQSKQAKLLN
ncbi:hypothetical protein A2690_02015 [Candidatus Roizmanbacteria bacterium RIFCSPHIGHO2_01_FULL_39_12b]|uniref:Uncharacterized protein n=1 Tax=Candidatus Roizmanbacteria bacterium RIFCSPHIGHO2_01_FULL_39_12b TaxID=1802030 RepID=A0A1F7G9Z9_9BACT|nr:MAG: hypothetical protein A2690_02015 [Candidatus Roizmanbacteria bacterium RIFCSPHIGHO2_01_FULL_39_12b]